MLEFEINPNKSNSNDCLGR